MRLTNGQAPHSRLLLGQLRPQRVTSSSELWKRSAQLLPFFFSLNNRLRTDRSVRSAMPRAAECHELAPPHVILPKTCPAQSANVPRHPKNDKMVAKNLMLRSNSNVRVGSLTSILPRRPSAFRPIATIQRTWRDVLEVPLTTKVRRSKIRPIRSPRQHAQAAMVIRRGGASWPFGR
jgi:hypothetical protein